MGASRGGFADVEGANELGQGKVDPGTWTVLGLYRPRCLPRAPLPMGKDGLGEIKMRLNRLQTLAAQL